VVLVISKNLITDKVLMKEPAMNWQFYGKLFDFSPKERERERERENHGYICIYQNCGFDSFKKHDSKL
jgi:hypothetical protein